jgi:hypothetical protein
MNLYLYWKLCRIRRAVKQLLAAKGVVEAKSVSPRIFWIGSYDIDPGNLFFVIGVQTDRERDRLRVDEQFSEQLRQALVTVDWPEAARPHVKFEIESDETVNRDSGGNWWIHYK